MMLVEETAVPDTALPVEAFKLHLRQGTGFSDDGLQDDVLHGFLRAALSAVEGRTGKALLERDFVWQIEGWREPDRVTLPIAPVSVVTGFVVEDATGTQTIIGASGWRLMPDAHRPSVIARLSFLAGFGPEWSDLPPDLAQAVMMLAAHYYEYRQDMALGAGCMPFGVTALIERYRNLRLFGGAAS